MVNIFLYLINTIRVLPLRFYHLMVYLFYDKNFLEMHNSRILPKL